MTNPQSGGSGLTILGKMFFRHPRPAPASSASAGGSFLRRVRTPNSPSEQRQTVQTGNNAGGRDLLSTTTTIMTRPPSPSMPVNSRPRRRKWPHLVPPIAYVPQNNIVDIELSEYAGYAGADRGQWRGSMAE